MLPYVLFVPDFETRKKAVMTCCLGWNISLFPGVAEREVHIERIWRMVAADTKEVHPPGLENGFKQDLRTLVNLKADLFPWLLTNIPQADLIQGDGNDVLNIATGSGDTEKIEIAWCPDPIGLPLVIDFLKSIQRDTAAQVERLAQARLAAGVLTDIDSTRMTTAYCMQRANLIGYRRVLTIWRSTQPAPSVKRVLGHWQGVLDEIERDTQTVLNILVSCR
ncbi:hypothetical protein [Rugamonas fusca]|nr:hypothetical protein [Rugamonas fusca]